MFDTTVAIKVEKPFPRLGDHDIVVRFPTDEEWTKRSKSRRFLKKRLGRGREQTIIPPPSESDQKLFEAISQNGTPSLTMGESQVILDFLGMANATGVSVAEGHIEVGLETMMGPVKHRFKIPNTDQILEARRASFNIIDLQYGQQEVRINPEPAARLWDQCEGSSEDYNGPIPIAHKEAAIRSATDYLDGKLAPKEDPNF